MTWEQKLMAIKALDCDAHPYMRHPGDWTVVTRIHRHKLNGSIEESCGGFSTPTPEDAVNTIWESLLDPDYVVRIRHNGANRDLKWNGFMWAEVTA